MARGPESDARNGGDAMTERPRLLIISFSPIESDARVLKQVRRFQHEYDVVTLGYGPAPSGVVEHLRVPDELPLWRWPRIPLLLRQYRRAYWSNPAIAAARRLLEGVRADVVLANDVESVGLALDVAPGTRVHADLHEYAPRQREELWRWRLFVAPFVDWMIRVFVTQTGSATTVSPAIAREYRTRYEIDVGVVINATPFADVSPTRTTAQIRLVHSGAGLANRGIELMIDAVENSNNALSLDLFLTPNHPAFLEKIRARCASSDRVTLHPPVAYSALIERLHDYDVGVFVLPPVNFNYRWALPNKLFDFVQARLGVVIGPSPEMVTIVEEWQLGVVVEDFSDGMLTRALDTLTAADVDRWKQASDRAARPLSAERQSELWVRAIAALSPAAP